MEDPFTTHSQPTAAKEPSAYLDAAIFKHGILATSTKPNSFDPTSTKLTAIQRSLSKFRCDDVTKGRQMNREPYLVSIWFFSVWQHFDHDGYMLNLGSTHVVLISFCRQSFPFRHTCLPANATFHLAHIFSVKSTLVRLSKHIKNHVDWM